MWVVVRKTSSGRVLYLGVSRGPGRWVPFIEDGCLFLSSDQADKAGLLYGSLLPIDDRLCVQEVMTPQMQIPNTRSVRYGIG